MAFNRVALMLELKDNVTNVFNLRMNSSKEKLSNCETSTATKEKCAFTPEGNTQDTIHTRPLHYYSFVLELKTGIGQLIVNTKDNIPAFLTKLVPLVEKGIKTEFIYSKSRNQDKVDKIKKKIIRNNFGSLEKYSTYDLACALKTYFLELNDPLLPMEVLEDMLKILGKQKQLVFTFNLTKFLLDVKDEIKKFRSLKRQAATAKIPHRETVEYILNHLVNVSRHEEWNKMSKRRIAEEWAPILSHNPSDQTPDPKYVQLLETLLQIYDTKAVINVDLEKDLKHNIKARNRVI